MLLAIDTSAGTSVAVVDRDAGVLSELSSDDTRRHAEVIGDLIAGALAEAGIRVTDLSGVVAGMGPGPFTGLRVGIAAARAFALGAGKRVVPVVSHDAIAFGSEHPVIVATDARRAEVYWSAYTAPDAAALPVRTHGPSLARASELESIVADLGAAAPAPYRLIEAPTVSAASLGLLAEALYASGHPFAADEPLYLRPPDVTVSSGRKRVTT